ncbi:Carboxypeptidase D [Hondaea fermentalgiana]|uniref:Carboxypeptidase D n=1 Tax=Hondaea fermentalgiana TaxID=2315210 RepID=A0A2R5GMQ1_9STRA|nr:Carboxypeptidase D [Hondaea fermentalgiana]|eukprot:GBG32166.1 Carboxypeptidase D [Hondaea fermentalgiana]
MRTPGRVGVTVAVLTALVATACGAVNLETSFGGVHPDDEEFAKLVGTKHSKAQGPFRTVKYLDYGDIVDELHRLEKDYPDLVELYDAQARYNLPSPGRCGSHGNCKQYVLRITNEATLPEPERPEVFFSGELHGNERVGPTTLMEFARLLLESYTTCSNAWLQRLVNTRSIYIMPTTNALGYYRNTRTENTIDPNRDFPIDKPHSCMETIAARAVNELWREHLFQLALTYHGGMQAIAFEWGTLTNRKFPISPDDIAQLMLGSAMSAVAGDLHKGEGPYPHDRLNDLVYPVRGGMEDWGYAGSWAASAKPCDPKHFFGYAKEKTQYTSDQLRAFNMLIETSRDKTPDEGTLGTTEEMMRPEGGGDGHIPRNVRLALFMTDLVQPYVQWVQVPDAADSADRDQSATLSFAWEVGGALFVDQTFLEYSYVDANGTLITQRTDAMSGRTRWNEGGVWSGHNTSNTKGVQGLDIGLVKEDDLHDRERWPFAPAFVQTLPPLPAKAQLQEVVAIAVVDQNWGKHAGGAVPPEIPPQSHVVNARTNAMWKAENADHIITGKLQWASDAVSFPRATRETPYCASFPNAPAVKPGNASTSGSGSSLRASPDGTSISGSASAGLVFFSILGCCIAGRLYAKARRYDHISYEAIEPSA